MVIVQLRGTIFAPLNISYTPENFKKFSEMLLPGAKGYNANLPGVQPPGVNPNLPQYGFPWRLFKKVEGEGDYNIVFLPGKIDIILTKDVLFGGETEREFCNKCVDWFSKILAAYGSTTVNRIAYAPLYAIRPTMISLDSIWGSILKKTVVEGTPMQDVSVNYLLKRPIDFSGNTIQMNLLHSFSDGMQIKQTESDGHAQKVILFQLDLNSIPEIPLTLDVKGIRDFYNQILFVKDNLVNNATEEY